MPYIQVQAYALAFGRTPSPPDAPLTTHYLTVIPLPFVGAGTGIDRAVLTYSRTPATSVGQRSGRLLTGAFPLEEFEVHWRILQTESPVYIEWNENSPNPSFLQAIIIRTGDEPVGEGLPDVAIP